MKFLPLIWSNLRRRKLRTLLTLLSIAVAFILYGYLAAIARALDQGVSVAGADRLLARHRVSITQPLQETAGPRMARLAGVKLVTPVLWFGGIYQDPKNFFGQMAVVPEPFLAMYPEYLLPENQLQAWLRTKNGVIVGRKTAERFGWKVGDRIPLQPTIWQHKDGLAAWEFEIVGIFDGAKQGTDTTNFFLRYDYLEEARRFGKGLVTWFSVKVANPEEAAAVAERIDREFANSPTETKTETEGAFLRGWARQIGDITTIMAAILAAVFFTILLVAGNTMAQSVRERTDELGVLKALGFTNTGVLGLVLGESCFLSGLGGGAGLLAAWLLIRTGDPTGGALPMFYFPVERVAAGVGLTLLLGLATGAFPAWQAMRLQIAEALRR
jgi:putative ABC transport system permease protein